MVRLAVAAVSALVGLGAGLAVVPGGAQAVPPRPSPLTKGGRVLNGPDEVLLHDAGMDPVIPLDFTYVCEPGYEQRYGPADIRVSLDQPLDEGGSYGHAPQAHICDGTPHTVRLDMRRRPDDPFPLVPWAPGPVPAPMVFARFPGYDTYYGIGVRYASPPVRGAILARYSQLGGAGGLLGIPYSAERPLTGRHGAYNRFQRGLIYWSPGTGARFLLGEIGARYESLGGDRSGLGLPVTDELRLPGRLGAFNHFENGSIYWSPATQAHPVLGAIRQRWAALGWEAGPLGLPRTGEFVGKFGRGRYSVFEGGEIHWCQATGAHEVRGVILQQWKDLGDTSGPLGYPVSGEYAVPGGRRSDFQAGSITWTPGGGARWQLVGLPAYERNVRGAISPPCPA